MIIAINTRMLSGDAATGKFFLEVFLMLAWQNSSHEFVFITERELTETSSLHNVKKVQLPQRSASLLRWKLWYNYKLPAVLRKEKAAVLLSVDSTCSLRTRVPQCMLVNDLEFDRQPGWFDKRYVRFLRSGLNSFLQKASLVITFSEHTKNELISKYKTGENNIAKIEPGVSNSYQPMEWKDRELTKEQYAGGMEYFLFHGIIHSRSNLVNLLKAFSLFKKRQKSSMRLVIAADTIPEKDPFIESLRLYKYRNELKIVEGPGQDELQALTAAAYCSINLSDGITDINFLLSSGQSGVPLVTIDSPKTKELFADAALYADAASPAAIAEQMMLVFKDENKRNELIKRATTQCAAYSLENTAAQLWQKILATAGQ